MTGDGLITVGAAVASVLFTGGGLIWHAAYIKGSIIEKISNIKEEQSRIRGDLNTLCSTVQYKDNCEIRHEDLDRRVEQTENLLNKVPLKVKRRRSRAKQKTVPKLNNTDASALAGTNLG